MNEGPLYAAIFARLQGDTILRALLGKTTFPYGVFREDFNPDFAHAPMVTLQWFGGDLGDDGDVENGSMAMSVRVYAARNIEAIHAQIKKTLKISLNPFSITDIQVRSLRLTNKGQEMWIADRRISLRMDTYLIRYSIYDKLT